MCENSRMVGCSQPPLPLPSLFTALQPPLPTVKKFKWIMWSWSL